MIGKSLGPYQILAELGRGGMGEVYRATDTRLDRLVAIKVLPAAFAQDPDRVARFEREAKTLASLNHPNVAQVYGVEDGALVMELLEGSTLRDRLKDGPLPVRKAIEYASQMARGLAAAHERGIIHRDLKPENVFITRDGQLKLLDFGLARPIAPRGSGATETVLVAGTDPGTVMGTVGYMAPEQVRAEVLDARTDLFALGAVLYEMLAGQRAFSRETPAETMTSILREDPAELGSIRSDLTPAVIQIVRHCLERNPVERFQTARDVAFALDALSGSGSGATLPAAATTSSRGLRERWLWALATTAVTAVALWLGLTRPEAPTSSQAPAYRAVVPLPEGQSLAQGVLGFLRFAVSPDGGRVAVVSGSRLGSGYAIWVLSLSDGTAQELQGTLGGAAPYWIPGGRRLSFSTNSGVKVLDLESGQTIEVPAAGYGDWNAKGEMLALLGAPGRWGVNVIRRPGDPAVELLKGTSLGEDYITPRLLPDGRRFVVVHRSRERPPAVEFGSLDGGAVTTLASDAITPIVAGGYLLFVRGVRLFAQPLDIEAGRLTGDPVALADRLDVSAGNGAAYSASDRVIVYSSGSNTKSRLDFVDRSGKLLRTVAEDDEYSNVSLSRDGRRVAVSLNDQARQTRDVYLVDLDRNIRQRLTFDPSDERSAAWLPDGQHVVYGSRDTRDLYRRRADFSGAEERLESDAISKDPLDISTDGRFLAFRRSGPGTNNDIWILPLDGDGKPQPVLETPFNENYGAFSPDGQSLAYVSDESGQAEVYVTSLQPGAGKTRISTKGGSFPRWRRPNEILYLSSEQDLISVAVSGSGATFQARAATTLFKMEVQGGPGSPFDVTPDGQRFVVNMRVPARLPPSLNIIVNWQTLLTARKP